MIISMMNSARSLRGQYEKQYEDQVLSDDVIETIVDEYAMSLPWLKDYDVIESFNEARILKKTLKWSSEYNRSQNET